MIPGLSTPTPPPRRRRPGGLGGSPHLSSAFPPCQRGSDLRTLLASFSPGSPSPPGVLAFFLTIKRYGRLSLFIRAPLWERTSTLSVLNRRPRRSIPHVLRRLPKGGLLSRGGGPPGRRDAGTPPGRGSHPRRGVLRPGRMEGGLSSSLRDQSRGRTGRACKSFGPGVWRGSSHLGLRLGVPLWSGTWVLLTSAIPRES